MTKPSTLQLAGFLTIVTIIAAILLFRLFSLSPLYVQSDLRPRVESALRSAVDREGWLLSNVDLRSVERQSAMLIYRDHHRGTDPETCYVLTLSDSSLQPCNAGR